MQTYKNYSKEFTSFDEIVAKFLASAKDSHGVQGPGTVALAVAGAVKDNKCELTNVKQFLIDGNALQDQYGIRCGLVFED
jgi:glucokinase